ncbi:MAG: ATP-dependent Clp protease ATP-binding protein ClpC [Chloroflexi bacterium]|nr:ATP-dependent Clp protease ATP-binding protein ClpC [Chloroflexota bacterium]
MTSDQEESIPSEYLKRLTTKGRRVLWKAEVEAAMLGHPTIAPEHILIAILRSPQTAGARVLKECRIDLDTLRESLLDAITPGESSNTGRRPLSTHGKNVLRASSLAAEKMGVRFIGTDHLLLGVLANGSSLTKGSRNATLVNFFNRSRLALIRHRVESAYRPEKPTANRTAHRSRRGRVGESRKQKRDPLAMFGKDLTAAAREGYLDPVVGRRSETNRVIEILLRRRKNNPVLVGDAGVGKTAVVEGLAHQIVNGNVPKEIAKHRLISVNLTAMLAGTKHRGDFEERCRGLIKEVRSQNDVVLFIDEIHTLVGAGGASGSLDASNMFMGHLARGEIQLIGATTWREYRQKIISDKSLTRRLQPIEVDEPNTDDALRILEALRPVYESYHNVKITDESLKSAVHLSQRFLISRHLPDKAIDLVDEASASAKVALLTPPNRILELERRLQELKNPPTKTQHLENNTSADNPSISEEESSNADQDPPDHPKSSTPTDNIQHAKQKIFNELHDEREAWREEIKNSEPTIGPEDIGKILASWTSVPLAALDHMETERFLTTEEHLKKRIVGQDKVLAELGKSLRRAMAGMRDLRRPIGSFLFLGESGVGKTETALGLAEFVTGTTKNIVRVDMSEMSESHNVSRLIGSPPGYVGYEDAGHLGEAVRRNPFCVVLFDDIDKAHPQTLQVLLQILDDGLMKDANGRDVDFRNTIVVLTSNFGVEYASGPNIGFLEKAEYAGKSAVYEERVRQHAVKHLPSPLVNRLDRIIVFDPLEAEYIREIARRALSDATIRAQRLNVLLHISSEALDAIVAMTINRHSGARPVARLINKYVDDQLANILYKSQIAGREFELQVIEGRPKIIEVSTSIVEK